LSLHWRILLQLCDKSSTISQQEPLPIFVIDSDSYHNHFTSSNYDPILLLKAVQKAPNKLISLFFSDVKSWIGKIVRLSRCEEKSESTGTMIRIVDMSVLE